MKYHITPKQAKEITEEQFYSMFNEIEHREDWMDYYHKNITIEKMIDILDEITVGRDFVDKHFCVFLLDGRDFKEEEFTDALWEAVKSLLNE